VLLNSRIDAVNGPEKPKTQLAFTIEESGNPEIAEIAT